MNKILNELMNDFKETQYTNVIKSMISNYHIEIIKQKQTQFSTVINEYNSM